jgi:Tfp pilus assembly protein PilF
VSRSLHRLLALGVFAATVATFLPALRNGFVAWDDDLLLTGNPRFRGLSPAHLRWMLGTTYGGHWEPLTWLTLAVDHAVWGMDPRGYHLTSVVLHGVDAVLVFALAVAVLRAVGIPATTRVSVSAAAGALVFALHPLRVESVAWASERRDVLSAALYLASVLAYLARERSMHRTRWLAVSVACFALATLAKGLGMTLPLVLVVLDVWPLGRFRSWRAARTALLEKLAYLPFAIAAGAMAMRALADAGSDRPSLAEFGVAQRLAESALGLVFYLWKTVVPVRLSPLYPLDRGLRPTAPLYLAAMTAVVGGAAVLLLLRRRAPWALAAATSYAILVAPVLGPAQTGPHAMADRYTYLACIPFALLAAAAIGVGLHTPRARWPTAVVTSTVLVVLALAAVRQTRIWHDSITLWTHALALDPTNVLAWTNRGWARQVAGDPRAAIADYDAALRLAPDDALAHERRALARQALGDPTGALADYDAALRAKPGWAQLHYDRGTAWQAAGNRAAAIVDYDEAARLAPGDPRPPNNRGVLRAASGDLDGAIADYSTAVRTDPTFVLGWLNRARARRARGDVAGAVADAESARRVAAPGSRPCTDAGALLVELGDRGAPGCGGR